MYSHYVNYILLLLFLRLSSFFVIIIRWWFWWWWWWGWWWWCVRWRGWCCLLQLHHHTSEDVPQKNVDSKVHLPWRLQLKQFLSEELQMFIRLHLYSECKFLKLRRLENSPFYSQYSHRFFEWKRFNGLRFSSSLWAFFFFLIIIRWWIRRRWWRWWYLYTPITVGTNSKIFHIFELNKIIFSSE